MKLGSLLLSGVVLTTLAACSGNDGKIEVQSSGAALTDKGGDALFTIKLLEARDEGYPLDGLRIAVAPDGKDAFDVVCTVGDADKNGKLDAGDTLACAEPADKKLGPDLAGKEAEVELFAKVDGEEQRVGDATWTPK